MPGLSFCSAAWLLFTGNDSSCGYSWMAVAGSSSRAQGSACGCWGWLTWGLKQQTCCMGWVMYGALLLDSQLLAASAVLFLHSVGCSEAGASRRLGVGGLEQVALQQHAV